MTFSLTKEIAAIASVQLDKFIEKFENGSILMITAENEAPKIEEQNSKLFEQLNKRVPSTVKIVKQVRRTSHYK